MHVCMYAVWGGRRIEKMLGVCGIAGIGRINRNSQDSWTNGRAVCLGFRCICRKG